MLTRRSILKGAFAIAAAAPVSGAVAAAVDLSRVTLRAATFPGETETLMHAAGLDDTTYKLAYSEFNAGNMIVEAMNAEVIDFGAWSEIPLVFAAASHATIKTVGVIKGDVNLQAVIVPKNSPIQDIPDLKGKRVGYVRGTTSHYFLLKMLQHAGLGLDDVQAINLTPTDGRAAFAMGKLDAWAIYGYAIPFAIAQNGARVLKTANGILSGNYFVGVHPKVLQTDPLRQAAADYLARLEKAYRWRGAHKEEWAKIVAPIIHVPENIVLATLIGESQPYRLVPIDEKAVASAQDVADAFVEAKLAPGPIVVDAYFDRSFSDALSGGTPVGAGRP